MISVGENRYQEVSERAGKSRRDRIRTRWLAACIYTSRANLEPLCFEGAVTEEKSFTRNVAFRSVSSNNGSRKLSGVP